MNRMRSAQVSPALCGLCEVAADLQESHIVPEFAYAPIYDGAHKLVAFEPLDPGRTWKLQKGLREPLLCRSCEQFLNNNYERWFKEYWFDQRPLAPLEATDHDVLSVPDAPRFKLFHLSVLLRADLARHPQWSSVRLGERHRTRLRCLIRSGDPGGADEYPIVCFAIRRAPADPSIWWELVAPVYSARMQGMRCYQFTFGGCGWLYYVSSHRMGLVNQVALRQDGSLPVVKREWGGFDVLRRELDSR